MSYPYLCEATSCTDTLVESAIPLILASPLVILVRELLSTVAVSSRTEHPVKNPKRNVYSHFLETGHQIQTKNFAILQTNQNFDLKISESIAIHKFKPDLNGMVTSVPLNILS